VIEVAVAQPAPSLYRIPSGLSGDALILLGLIALLPR
jgi:hypothetical protein